MLKGRRNFPVNMARLRVTLITVVENPAQYEIYYIDASLVTFGSIHPFLLGPWYLLKLQWLWLLFVSNSLGLLDQGEHVVSCYMVGFEACE